MNKSEIKHKYLKISGRVQGVGFRYFTRQNAERLGISGWVRNMPDGTVEAVISGDHESVKEMVEKLREGPRTGKVTDIQIRDTETDTELNGFRVRRS